MKRFFILIVATALLITLKLSAQFNEYYPEVNWYTIETEHFFVHFHEGTERTAKVIAKIAEEIYTPITSLYGYEPGKVHFVIKDIDDYANGATYFFDNKIEIWASALDTELRGTTHWLRNVISHEYTHMIQLQASMKTSRKMPAIYLQWLNYEEERRPDVLYGYPNGIISYPVPGINIPSWFAEGTAQYMRKQFEYDFWDTHRDMVLRSYFLDNNMLTWNQMQVFGKTSLGNESVYNSGFALVNYIAEKYGEKTVIEINKNASSPFTFTIDAAIKKTLGITGKELYNEWVEFLKKDYANRVERIRQNLFTGSIIAETGFANLYPKFSPDGKKVFYLSNKKADYFQTGIFEYDLNTKSDKLIQPGVFSTIDITPDGKKLIYSKITDDNKNGAKIHDIYEYNLETKKETRLTFSERANNPSLSKDGNKIVFIVQKDGTTNIFTSDINGKNIRQVTTFLNGEQVFTPKLNPGGDKIIFDMSLNDSRDIYQINTDGSNLKPVIKTEDDERSPVWLNENELIFTADYSGIYNIYKLTLSTGEKKQVTNVLGGAFYPEVDNNRNIVYSGYTSSGYKIYLLDSMTENDFSNYTYLARKNKSFLAELGVDNTDNSHDWNKLKDFDDSLIPQFDISSYKGKFTALTIIPFIRLDNYSKKAKGVELIKPGFYFYSSDMLNRFNIMGGASINTRWERDLFLQLEYRDRIIGLYDIGLKPEISLEVYNVSRTSTQTLGLLPDSTQGGEIDYQYKIPVNIDYNLLEFDFRAKHKLFNDNHWLTLSFVYSRYESIIESFILPGPILYPSTRDVYLIGRNFNLKYQFQHFDRTIDDDIDPTGIRLTFKYDYESDKFNPEGEYEVNNGMLLPKYQNISFNRFELNLTQNIPLPYLRHSIGYRLRLGTTLGPKTDEFFDFYLGGLIGMKGYPFYAISGNEVAYLNINYRFPIARNIDTRLGHLYIDKIFGSIYADFGHAWDDKAITMKDIKKGAGFELRIQMNSFYIFPTSFFFNLSYAFDEFSRTTKVTKDTVRYGKELRYYFGVLFDFDFIQDSFRF